MNTALLVATRRSPERASSKVSRPLITAGVRAAHDFYPTPPEAVRALLSVEHFDGPIWEPACGDGAISKELERHGHSVVSTDLIDRGYGEAGCDFLSASSVTRIMLEHDDIRNVVTNPPYSYKPGIGDKFVGQALKIAKHTGGKVAMMLNLASLASRYRTAKWHNDPPARIHIMDDLVCWPNGNPINAGLSIVQQRYCWIVWAPDRSDGTHLTWLRMADFRGQGGAA